MQITLSRALSIKKRLIGEIERLGKLLTEHNSHRVENTPEYDTNDVLKKWVATKEKLVALKDAINKANQPIQAKIFKISELKDTIVLLRKIPTKTGKHYEGTGRYGSEQVEMEFKSVISRSDLDELIEATQDDIDEIQAELDAHNASISIEYEA